MNEVQAIEPTQPDHSPAALMMQAVEKGLDLDKVAKAMELQEKWEALQAKRAYVQAMSKFKANPPVIDKDRHVKYGNTNYSHASLANVTTKINAALSEHGLSAQWRTGQADGLITVACTITHIAGHSESTSLTASPDSSGSKNSIQAIGSAISYLSRYTLLALTGLATHDQDNDGATVGQTESISTDQATEINDLINSLYSDPQKGVQWIKSVFKVAEIEAIPKDKYQEVLTALNTIKKRAAK